MFENFICSQEQAENFVKYLKYFMVDYAFRQVLRECSDLELDQIAEKIRMADNNNMALETYKNVLLQTRLPVDINYLQNLPQPAEIFHLNSFLWMLELDKQARLICIIIETIHIVNKQTEIGLAERLSIMEPRGQRRRLIWN